MSSLLTSLKLGGGHHQVRHQRDEHGVAELLEAVSQRSMSCSEEERREIGDIVKRVQNYKKQPSPMERFQQKLALKTGDWNSNSRPPPSPATSVTSRTTEATSAGTPNVASPSISSPVQGNSWGKDFMRSFSKINVSNPLSPTPPESPATNRRTTLMATTPKDTAEGGVGLLSGFRAPSLRNLFMSPPKATIEDISATTPPRTVSRPTLEQQRQEDLLRGFESAPTMVILPPVRPNPQEGHNNDDDGGDTRGSSSSSSSLEDYVDKVDKEVEVNREHPDDQDAAQQQKERPSMTGASNLVDESH